MFVCLEIEVFGCELCLGVCVGCGFCDCSLGLHLFWFCRFGGKTMHIRLPYHEFWIPGSPGAMILVRVVL